jgi:hypothetical protein
VTPRQALLLETTGGTDPMDSTRGSRAARWRRSAETRYRLLHCELRGSLSPGQDAITRHPAIAKCPPVIGQRDCSVADRRRLLLFARNSRACRRRRRSPHATRPDPPRPDRRRRAGLHLHLGLRSRGSLARTHRQIRSVLEEPKVCRLSPLEETVSSELVSLNPLKFPASWENELRVFASLADAKARLD